ncbi:ZIP family metal transporter [Microbacterium sp. W4I20]|uniref:ZIP family metal transporter n=1 Tax=Microbacterium sp. W4I20 TaxID=3042262 RepID=UPI00278ABB37|nr:ZIP family metal transporter [Microbacterium sp. W4I20]MDQ0727419.1 ZIP family zinc transporter [Microbacterium sp. W4I20]
MGEAVLWGAVAASPLFVGAVLAILRAWPPRWLGIVLGFGAGALMASIAFELWEEGLKRGGVLPLVAGVAAGALSYYIAARILDARAAKKKKEAAGGGQLAVGALLDGIPEQLVLGIGLASGEPVSIALVVAILVSNLPESIGSAADLLKGGMSRSRVLLLWAGVAVVCALATVAGFGLATVTGDVFRTAANGFAAGALLVMLVDSMIPEAQSKAKELTGLATVLGFALAAGLALSS